MQIEFKTDNHITYGNDLSRLVESEVEHALGRFGEQIVRVLVHVNDANGHKGGDRDKRCMMEARLDRRLPIAVTHHADTVESALHGAARRLAKAIEGVIGRAQAHRPLDA
ncbi:MAG: ribosomal subunit interface protein, partial [Isosphaeraceae bacterium]|nr:ribosomal subunit interface protein [Isosphaeraceae bacterium]